MKSAASSASCSSSHTRRMAQPWRTGGNERSRAVPPRTSDSILPRKSERRWWAFLRGSSYSVVLVARKQPAQYPPHHASDVFQLLFRDSDLHKRFRRVLLEVLHGRARRLPPRRARQVVLAAAVTRACSFLVAYRPDHPANEALEVEWAWFAVQEHTPVAGHDLLLAVGALDASRCLNPIRRVAHRREP